MFDFTFMPTLNTDRLILREIRRTDVGAIFDLFSDPDVTASTDVETLQHLRQAGGLIEFVQDRFHKKIGMRWGITVKAESDAIIGTCGYNVWTHNNRCGEIGYDLAKGFWNQGIMAGSAHGPARIWLRPDATQSC